MWAISSARIGSIQTLQYNQKYVHSRIDPLKEAKQFVHNIFLKPNSCYIILGIGLGHHIDLLYKKILLEQQNPHILCVFTSTKEQDLFLQTYTQYKSHEYLKCILITQYKTLENWIIESFQNRQIMGNISLIEYMPILYLFKNEFSKWKNTYQSIYNYEQQNFYTQSYFGNIWVNNILANIKYMTQNTVNIQLNGDVILVSAGFSVASNLVFLKQQVKNKIPIIAVDTILPSLVDADIYPDIIIACDAQVDNYYDFLIDKKKQEHLFHYSILVGDITQYYKIPKKFQQVLFFKTQGMVSQWAEFLFKETINVISGGSVASFALYVIQLLGASRIVLVGQDLSYIPLTHCVSTYHQQKKLFNSDRLNTVFNKSYQWLLATQPIKAQDKMLKNLTHWIEDFFRVYPIKGLHKSPVVPLRTVQVYQSQILNGSVSKTKQPYNKTELIYQHLMEISYFLGECQKTQSYAQWSQYITSCNTKVQKLLYELLSKSYLYKMIGTYNEKVFMESIKLTLVSTQKRVKQELDILKKII